MLRVNNFLFSSTFLHQTRTLMSYATLVNDHKWRSSTFHFIFGHCSAYIDISCGADGSNATTKNMSFDGAGCLSTCQLAFPEDIAKECLALVPNHKDKYEIPEDSPLATKIETFFKLKIAGKEIPEDWVEDFGSNDVVRGMDNDDE